MEVARGMVRGAAGSGTSEWPHVESFFFSARPDATDSRGVSLVFFYPNDCRVMEQPSRA